MLLEAIIGEWSLRKQRRKERDTMEEHSKREEPLKEELLEGITGGTGGASGLWEYSRSYELPQLSKLWGKGADVWCAYPAA